MNIKNYLKDKLASFLLITFSIITIEVFLLMYPVNYFIKIYIPLITYFAYFTSILIEYHTKKTFYNNFLNTLNDLKDKYLITEIVNNPSFEEGKILTESLSEIDKSMIENVNKYKYLQEDYKEYIELWIHEIKIPLATSKLMIENNKNEITKNIDEELDKIENYIEQALFYARSNTVEKDYLIKDNNLEDIVKESIKKNKNQLIQDKISIDLHDLNTNVKTDNKWIIFIINQLIQNSIKYKKNDILSKIEIYSEIKKESTILYIKDNGIGIEKNEISKIFDKGFTGTNGRMTNKKSTGIGLYLCKKLCEKLNISISANSVKKQGTEIKLIFPTNSFTSII